MNNDKYAYWLNQNPGVHQTIVKKPQPKTTNSEVQLLRTRVTQQENTINQLRTSAANLREDLQKANERNTLLEQQVRELQKQLTETTQKLQNSAHNNQSLLK